MGSCYSVDTWAADVYELRFTRTCARENCPTASPDRGVAAHGRTTTVFTIKDRTLRFLRVFRHVTPMPPFDVEVYLTRRGPPQLRRVP